MIVRAFPAVAALLLAACGQQPADPGTVTADEDRQLNEAAASLEANLTASDDPEDNAP